ncbi:MAG TPA: cupin domain-containing protein [Candidatus Acidoferrum sp.]|nr:cupin domain-containing protein [Candidatus Acidoferrum sp.]
MSKAIVEELNLHIDARGLVFEPLDPAQIPAQRNVHLVITEPGTVRGNHYHEDGTEVSVVVGPALVRVREDGQTRDVRVPENRAMRFTFPPRVSHAVKNVSVQSFVMISFNTSVYDRVHPDVVPDILIE